uniref:Uncharacterized protein n=1 Tax=Arundo donax TaxID=35708 RepID=A0A0A8ZV92_ARUDO
MAQPFSLKR